MAKISRRRFKAILAAASAGLAGGKRTATATLTEVSNVDGTLTVSTSGTKPAPGKKIVSWLIEWNDGQWSDQGPLPATISHTYASSGTYLIDLQITDSAGNMARSFLSSSITVNPPAPIGAPSPPSNLVTSLISNTQINMTYNDNSSNETGFEIWRQTDGGAFALLVTKAANSTSHSDTTVVAGHTYGYKVRSVNGEGSSTYSNTSSQNTGAGATDNGGYRPQMFTTFGMSTPAGRGAGGVPIIIRVNTRSDTGAGLTLVGGTGTTSNPFVYTGELRAALTASPPRFVVIEVNGYIDLTSGAGGDIRITNPYITVAGQTAPSPGMTVRNYGIDVRTHDVVLQHFRIRKGFTGSNFGNCFTAWNISNPVYNIVLDHMSLSWGEDENCDWVGATNCTFWRSITSENLNFASGSVEAGHGMLLNDDAQGIASIQSLFHSNNQRNPYVTANCKALLINNVVYNWYKEWGFFFNDSHDGYNVRWLASCLGNRFIRGPLTVNPADENYAVMFYYASLGGIAGDQIYRNDNTLENNDGNIIEQRFDPAMGYDPNVGSSPAGLETPAGLTILASTAAKAFVQANAGARPLDRDSVDTRLMSNLDTYTYLLGNFISSQTDVGGWPSVTNSSLTFVVPSNPFSVADAVGRTNLEVYLESNATYGAQRLEP